MQWTLEQFLTGLDGYRSKIPLEVLLQGLGELRIDSWVLSCRAFSRRIEHAILDFLFRRLELAAIELEFCATPRNAPIQDFMGHLSGDLHDGAVRIELETWRERCLPLFHEIGQTA